MNQDIRLDVGFFGHRKTKRLIKLLGLEAVICLQKLWIHTSLYRSDGRLDGYDEEDIETAVDWTGEPGVFVSALMQDKICFLEQDSEGTFIVHNWEERQPFAVEAEDRADKARFSKLAGVNPGMHAHLKDKKINKITKEEYQRYKNCQCSPEDSATAQRPTDECTTTAQRPTDECTTTVNERSALTLTLTPSPSLTPNVVKNTTSSEPQNGSELEVSPENKTVTEAITPVLKIPLVSKDKKTGEQMEFSVIQDDLDNWIESFPAVDVLQELKKLREWNRANPEKRKTQKGIRSHIVKWLTKAQDKGVASKLTSSLAHTSNYNGGKNYAANKPAFTGNDTRPSEWECPTPAWAKDLE